ncbi:hypothetical protein BABINDRAFT_11041 [Babjeviella inositovora NRRL Y-12698]|uniref:FAM192A/Fyv6 N-terminal domain-containing protein n=1 Tax=Babjeviella inositovora NRRL Y-12698 TaxID=984486 RepID=A0A1E3QYH6_9ASCO|nr:uncharacterized protein BABINDRAFT_11041 [Babjeviella inositovora NRRL Y-12698]ODQ82644.1 hypothetical protein BABINDRAFT_11041 [Babjeviella inositovora NRRL Y-12698]
MSRFVREGEISEQDAALAEAKEALERQKFLATEKGDDEGTDGERKSMFQQIKDNKKQKANESQTAFEDRNVSHKLDAREVIFYDQLRAEELERDTKVRLHERSRLNDFRRAQELKAKASAQSIPMTGRVTKDIKPILKKTLLIQGLVRKVGMAYESSDAVPKADIPTTGKSMPITGYSSSDEE